MARTIAVFAVLLAVSAVGARKLQSGTEFIIDMQPATVVATPTETVVDIAANSGVTKTLAAAVVAAGLDSTLSGEGPFTVFAPTDEAFAALDLIPADAITSADFKPSPELTSILTYHVVAGQHLSSSLSDGMLLVTEHGAPLHVTVNATGVFINDVAKVVTADIEAGNGVVHLIDVVLRPTANHGEMAADQDIAAVESMAADMAAAKAHMKSKHAESIVAETAQEPDVEVVVEGSMPVDVEIEGNMPVDVEVEGDMPVGAVEVEGGMPVTVVEKLTLPGTVLDIEAKSGVTTLFKAAITAAGLDAELSGDGPYTVFTPYDGAVSEVLAAFNMTAEQLLGQPALLKRIIAYHVVPGKLFISDLSDGQELVTAGGLPLNITKNSTGIFLNGLAQVSELDLEAGNGVVHLIDMVLPPPVSAIIGTEAAEVVVQEGEVVVQEEERIGTLMDFSGDNGQTNMLAKALTIAGLDEVLSDRNKNFTVFAPSDAAFAKIGINSEEDLKNTPNLESIMSFHILTDGMKRTRDMSPGQLMDTMNGNPLLLTVNVTDGRARGYLNSQAAIIAANAQTANGSMHLIDNVLTPPGREAVPARFCSWKPCGAGAKAMKGGFCNKGPGNCEKGCNGNWCVPDIPVGIRP